MKKLSPYIGLSFIILGTLVLAVTRISSLSSHNSLLIIGLLCIVAGIWLYIRHLKKESRF